MSKCPKCKSPMYVHKCMECLHSETPKVKKGALPCEWPCTATIHVQETLTGKPILGVRTMLDGAPDDTDANGFRVVESLAPGSHVAGISLASLVERYARPIGQDDSAITKTIAASDNEFYTFTLDPLTALKVVVKRRHDGGGVANAKLTIAAGKAGNEIATKVKTTPDASGEVTFTRLRQDTYKLKLELDDPGKTTFQPEFDEDHHVLDMSKYPDEHVLWVRLVIHLKLKYKDPDDTVRHFPKDFPVKVAFDDGTTKDVKVLDDAGYIKFEVEDAAKKKFTLKFDSTTTRYLVHEDGKPKAELKADPTDDDLFKLSDAGKQFFALPKTWQLAQSAWDATNVVVPTDGQIVIPAEGIGTSAAPAELSLKPKLLHVRFQFFDRKYGQVEHAKKPVGIPAVVLKAVRESSDDGTPTAPLAGTHDTISNWMVDKADNDNACQCLPWIITKTTAGVDLAKFNNKLMFEFGRENAFVHSTAAGARKIVVLPATDARRKPNRDRNQYYDLPKLWKSKYYFIRFSDATKNKFFDELAAADDANLEAAIVKDAKLTFSLDDVVLVNGTSQAVKDKDEADGVKPLSEHSRIAMLMLDPKDDKYNVVLYKPRATAPYWSENNFQKEAATELRRNVIVDCPVNPRAVVFCEGFYDIYDKRTETTTFADKAILGARAAKLEDTEISSVKTVFGAPAVTKAYVHRRRAFHLHYLHYAATDGTTVYGAMVTMWTCRFAKDTAKGGTDEVVEVYREEGMKRAMDRWNEKDYFFEEDDDKHEIVVKHFCLFEAKDTATAPTAVQKRGGKAICTVTLKDDSNGGSSASGDGLTMDMRRSGALDEGDSAGIGTRANVNGWGNDRWPEHPPPDPKFAPNSQPLTPIPEYDKGNASPANALAHELGHAAIGLWDDYVTGKLMGNLRKYKVLPEDASVEIEGQRYPGMPYELDKGAIMRNNRSVRLRYYWGRANWLNDEAKLTLQKFLSDKRFRLAYVPSGGAAKLKFSKPDEADYRSIYKPVKFAKPYSLGNNGRCDLHLYHLGDDEFSKHLDGGPYNGVLAICVKLSARFKLPEWAVGTEFKVDQVVTRTTKTYRCTAQHTPAAIPGIGSAPPTDPPMSPTQWSEITAKDFAKEKLDHLEDLNKRLIEAVQGKFKLQGNGRFSTTYLRVFPQWEIVAPTAAALAGTHFKIEFEFGTNTFTPASDSIAAGTKCNPKSIIRYLLGKIGDVATDWPTQGGVDGDLTKDDFPRLKAWMDTNAAGRFNVGAI